MKPKSKQVFEKCNVCQQQRVVELAAFSELRRVTSDCQAWKNNGRLGICMVCGCIQKIVDQVWLSEIEQIYQNYSIYHQGGGMEQSVFDPVSGQPTPRSEVLFSKLASCYSLPERGRLLDVGCGNGAFLRVFSKNAPKGWSLSGIDLNTKHIETLKRIERFEELYTSDLSEVSGSFDMISMIYVLEHIVHPNDYIKNVLQKLNPNGYLFVEVPDYYQNPFDLLIADHCTHFTFHPISTFMQRSGFENVSVATDWIPKGLTIVARKGKQDVDSFPSEEDTNSTLSSLINHVNWLRQIIEEADSLSAGKNFGIFGTGIAATWLVNELGNRASFFVDEDPNRANTTYLGRPVYPPQSVPENSHVFIVLPTNIAEKIKMRMQAMGHNFTCYVPSAIETKK